MSRSHLKNSCWTVRLSWPSLQSVVCDFLQINKFIIWIDSLFTLFICWCLSSSFFFLSSKKLSFRFNFNMPLEYASCDDQYKKFPKLDKAEVLKLQEWYEKQPHLPNVTGSNYSNYMNLRKSYSVTMPFARFYFDSIIKFQCYCKIL